MKFFVSTDKFGKDHWSLLTYIESCCVDGIGAIGEINFSKVRCNIKHHHLMSKTGTAWKDTWGTKLKGYKSTDLEDIKDAEKRGVFLSQHDDWDCIDDLSHHGYIEVVSFSNGLMKMTDDGMRFAAQIRAHKANGGMFSNFVMNEYLYA